MKKTTKILAVLLAMIMACSCLSVVAFAEEVDDYDKRVDGWNANYDLFLDHLFDDASFTSWNYVDINEKAMTDTMAVWTAFALYDEAWRNYATHHISIEQAELILLALIEKVDYEFDDGYVDEFVDVLELSQDAQDLVEKAGDIIKNDAFTKVLESEAWGTTWQVIGDVTKIAHSYQTRRDQFIEEYSRVLSVQLANQYYLDLLQYIADTTPYAILKQAAKNLIADMNANVQTCVVEVLKDAVMDNVSLGIDRLIELAMNSNVYTATVLEIYDAIVSVADFLWNTNEVYPHMETVLAAYYFQDAASDWAAEAYYQEEAEKSFFAIDLLMTTRKVCEQALVNFKNAENGGAVGRVKNQLHGTLCEDTLVNIAGLDIMRSMMFDLEPSEFKVITDSLYVYCPVSVDLLDADNNTLFTVADGAETLISNEYGVFKTIYSDFGEDYLKVAYLYDGYRVRLTGNNNGYVTLIHKELLDDGSVNDWSFTDVEVTKSTRLLFDTEVEGTPTYSYSNGSAVQVVNFNDTFIPSEYPEYTAKDVVDAGGEIIKDEAKSIWDKIVEFFEKIGQWFRDLFGIKD
ncbi:MAG: hypothetical protein E7573_08155 [Ruminococcaceae bacterium]|nr:hypothetical protein [Oscillospiraceae bacterium]MBR3596301.1 hypothetical protein [Clostridia bacterium]